MTNTSFINMIREANIQSIVKREQQVAQAELHYQNARREAERLQDEADALAVAEIMAASEPVTGSRLLVMEAQFSGQALIRDAERWGAQARDRAQRAAQFRASRVAALQEEAAVAAEVAALAVTRRASLAVQAWTERVIAARRELDTLVALENPEESVWQEYEAQFNRTVVRRRDLAKRQLANREKLAQEKQQAVLAQYDVLIETCRRRAGLAELYATVTVEKRVVQAVDKAREEAALRLLEAQLEAEEIQRLAAPQIERAHARAADLKQTALAQGNLLSLLAQEALDEARAELDEARRLAPQAAVELDHRREAQVLRKQVGRLARAGQVTAAMQALAQARALDPASPYLPGCEKAIHLGVQAQQVKELVRQIEAVEGLAQLDDLWARAEELGITRRVESIWKGRKAKLHRAQERLLDWTSRYAVDIARHVVEPGQRVMLHKDRPGIVFVLDTSRTVVQLHQLQGHGCWKTIQARRCSVNLADLAEVQI
jgi:hypothetical protein